MSVGGRCQTRILCHSQDKDKRKYVIMQVWKEQQPGCGGSHVTEVTPSSRKGVTHSCWAMLYSSLQEWKQNYDLRMSELSNVLPCRRSILSSESNFNAIASWLQTRDVQMTRHFQIKILGKTNETGYTRPGWQPVIQWQALIHRYQALGLCGIHSTPSSVSRHVMDASATWSQPNLRITVIRPFNNIPHVNQTKDALSLSRP